MKKLKLIPSNKKHNNKKVDRKRVTSFKSNKKNETSAVKDKKEIMNVIFDRVQESFLNRNV